MEDGGSLDPARSRWPAAAVLLGVVDRAVPRAAGRRRARPAWSPTPRPACRRWSASEGPQALLERPGLALLGGLLLAGAVVLCSVVAPSLRPRLATVGGLLAITVAVLAAALAGLRDAVVSPDLEWTLPGAGLLLAGLGYAGLTVLAWRLRRSSSGPPSRAGRRAA